jgi:[acyl-carrier-protein] S-malonyltransferase
MSLHETLGSSYAFVFPGQGSQYVGMAKDLVDRSDAARDVVSHADALLGFNLSDLMFNGPEEELADTYNAQPAIFTASVAALRALEEHAASEDFVLAPMMVAGHSLGEFTALVAAGVIDFETGLRLVRARGQAMAEAGVASPGAMAAVLGMDDDKLAALVDEAAQGDVLTLANLNCPGQTVISGAVEPLERFMDLAKDAGARRIARLPISIASHSALMEPAAVRLNELFDELTLGEPDMPVVSNSTGQPLHTAEESREELRHHVVRGVNWTGTIQTMVRAGMSSFIELGPGSVLAGLNRRIDKSTRTLSLKDLGLPSA